MSSLMNFLNLTLFGTVKALFWEMTEKTKFAI